MRLFLSILIIMAVVNLDFAEIMNPHFHPLVYNKDRYLVLYGGSDSGKSHFAAEKLILRTLIEDNHKILCIRKTRPAVKKSCYTLLIDKLKKFEIPFIENKTDLTIDVNTSQFICIGVDDPEMLKSIEGVTGTWEEEPTELTLDKFREIDRRLRGQTKYYKQHILSFNPISKLNYVYEMLFDKSVKHFDELRKLAKYDHSTYKDNKYRGPEDERILESYKNQDYNSWLIYAKGKWGELKGLIYDNFREEYFEYEINWYDSLFGGIDFGYVNPSSFSLMGEKEQEPFIIDEVYGKGFKNPQFIELVKEKFDEYKIPYDSITIYADHRPEYIDEFCDEGFDVRAANKKTEVKTQIEFLKRLKGHVNPRCVDHIKEFGGYKFKLDRNGKPMEIPVEISNHAMDGSRYGIYSHFEMLKYGPQIWAV